MAKERWYIRLVLERATFSEDPSMDEALDCREEEEVVLWEEDTNEKKAVAMMRSIAEKAQS